MSLIPRMDKKKGDADHGLSNFELDEIGSKTTQMNFNPDGTLIKFNKAVFRKNYDGDLEYSSDEES